MSFLKWLFLAAVSLVLTAVSVFGAPVLVLLAGADGNLPRGLSWLQTADATLDGDQYWRDPAAHPLINRLPRYLRRLLWMWRNPGGGFDQRVAGVEVHAPVRWWGDAGTSNLPGHAGWCIALTASAWMLYLVTPWWPGRCLRVYLGWKLMRAVHEPGFSGRLPLVLSANPFMSFVTTAR